MKNAKNSEKKPYWSFKAAAREGEGELFIYGDIVSWQYDEGDTSANSFKRDLDALGDIHTLQLYINSPGGSVFEGLAIHNILKRHKAFVIAHIDPLAASIASVIAMAADEIRMPRNAMMMIHNPWRVTLGNAAEHRKAADDLDRIGASMRTTYLDRAGDRLTDETLTQLLEAESWLSAQECYDYGLCDVIGESSEVAACISEELFAKYRNVPAALLEVSASGNQPPPKGQDPEASGETAKYLQSIREIAALEIQNIKSFLGGITHG